MLWIYQPLFVLSNVLVCLAIPRSPSLFPSMGRETQKAVHVRTDEANFGPAPISLSFSVKVNNFLFYETILKVTLKLPKIPSVIPIIKLYISIATKSLFPNLESWLKYLPSYEFFKIPYREHWNLCGVRYMRLKVVFSYVGPDLESSPLQLKRS